MSALTYGSLFAGVGGFDTGFDRAGMECRWQVEWDRNCQKLLQRKWPNAKHYEDVTTVRAGELERVDVICGGSPCQDLSVAGKRAGMAGGRSGLFHEMVRICKRVRPRFVVWENVDGAFSSNEGRDFATVLRAFTGVAVEVPDGGWGRAGFIKTAFPEWRWNCAWRLFDLQFFGVPQRRRRVFLVASAGDGSCAEILFESESLRGDSPPSRDSRERIAGSISSRTEGGGGLGTDFEIGGGLIPTLGKESYSPTKCSSGQMEGFCIPSTSLIPDVVGVLNNLGHHGWTANAQSVAQGHVIARECAHSLCAHSAKGGDPTTDNYAVIAFSSKDHGADAGPISPTLRACPHDGSHANGGGPPAIAFHPTQDPIVSTNGTTHSLGCGSVGGQASVAVAQPLIFQTRVARNGRGAPEKICPALNGTDAGDTSDMRPVVHVGMAVRRLTPKECERLQGFSDDHTIGFSDSTRYKMMGNAVGVPHSEWIGRRIVRFSHTNIR